MIDQGTIDKVMETAQAQILEVVSEFVTLKKRGINYLGNCPFHNEKTPSFIVSPHKGIFKCFGCGKGGNALSFIMEHEQFQFVDAIKYLGKKFHIHIEEKELSPHQQQVRNDRESLMVATSFAQKYFTNTLHQSDEGISVGLGYFRKRGFRDDIIAKFELGYSPEKKDAFTEEALKSGFKLEFLEKTGLTIVRDNYRGDRFRGRVIFPIHSVSGKSIAFGGRILKTDAKAAKYLNSPESDIYHKSKILYGIFQAKQEITRMDNCYLVEGYTDVISLHQAGITNVVASSGTALTIDQIRLIGRFTNNVTIIYDGDPAGIKASFRGIDLVLEEGLNVKVLLLPEGEDPDSFSRSMSPEELLQYIDKNKTDFIKFKTGLLLQDAANDPVKRAQLIQDIVRSISVIPEPITRSVYIKECSALLEVDEPVLYSEIGKITQRRIQNTSSTAQSPSQPLTSTAQTQAEQTINIANPYELEEREVIRFIIKFGELTLFEEEVEGKVQIFTVGEYIIQQLREDDLKSVNPTYNLMLELYEENHTREGFNSQRFFVNNTNLTISQLASDLLSQDHFFSKIHQKMGFKKKDEDILDILVPKIVLELKYRKIKKLIEEIMHKIKAAETSKNIDLLMEHMQHLKLLNNAKGIISRELGNRAVG